MNWVNDYMRIPFADGGRDKTGCDCWGLVRLILKEQAGIEISAYAGTSAEDHINVNRNMVSDSALPPWQKEIALGDEQTFDVVLLTRTIRTDRGASNVPMHVGLVTEPGWMIHTEKHVNATHVRLDGLATKRKILSIHRHEVLATRCSHD